jgi:hypothetical protein
VACEEAADVAEVAELPDEEPCDAEDLAEDWDALSSGREDVLGWA